MSTHEDAKDLKDLDGSEIMKPDPKFHHQRGASTLDREASCAMVGSCKKTQRYLS